MHSYDYDYFLYSSDVFLFVVNVEADSFFIHLVSLAVSVTSCKANNIADAAAVLKHSIKLATYPTNKNSKYGYKMFVFLHPDALECVEPFQKLGYEIQLKQTPIDPSQIEGQFLREHVTKTGCCGEKEFLKLYAYTLVDYEIVVHLDLDSLVLQPFDDLFNSMLLRGNEKTINDEKLPVMHGKPVPENIEAYFTRDYNMLPPGKFDNDYVNIQGGLIIVKPSLEYFEEYKIAILKGDFKQGAGWEGKYGGWFGAQQIQGLCSYFFDGLHPGTAVELNRCIYNSMHDTPRKKKRHGDEVFCTDGKESCEDCRETDISLIKSVHFTLCQKPWICPSFYQKLCKEFHKKWFQIRKDYEQEEGIFFKDRLSTRSIEEGVFQGYCKGGGERNYVAINITSI